MEYGPELIIELKKQYSEIYEVELGTTRIIFRALTFKEFDELSIAEDYSSSAEAEELIVKCALLHPPYADLEKLSAGYISALAEEIVVESCFFDVKKAVDKLEEAREKMNEVRSIMKVFILSAMPAYKIEELDDQTFSQLIDKVALAEEILDIDFHIQRASSFEDGSAPELQFLDPEKEAAQQKRAVQKHDASRPEGSAIMGDPVAQRLHQSL